jgi:hypothetical protein
VPPRKRPTLFDKLTRKQVLGVPKRFPKLYGPAEPCTCKAEHRHSAPSGCGGCGCRWYPEAET